MTRPAGWYRTTRETVAASGPGQEPGTVRRFWDGTRWTRRVDVLRDDDLAPGEDPPTVVLDAILPLTQTMARVPRRHVDGRP